MASPRSSFSLARHWTDLDESALTQVFIAAEFIGKRTDNCFDDVQAFIDAGLVIGVPAFIQTGQCDVDRRMVVASGDELLNPARFRFYIHFCMQFRRSAQYSIT